MKKMSVAEARKILGDINIEIDDKQMEEMIQFLYQLAQIEYEGYVLRCEKEAPQRKTMLT